MRLEGPLEDELILSLNGGEQMPPEAEHNVKNMYGNVMIGWYVSPTRCIARCNARCNVLCIANHAAGKFVACF
jgi:hypothetical protein